jgi:hypothetical protein
LGVWRAINGIAYLIPCLTGELLPQYQNDVFNYLKPAFMAEVALMLWLLIKGARTPKGAEHALTLAASE